MSLFDTVFRVTGHNEGCLSVGRATLGFTNISTLIGGAGDDRFVFDEGAYIDGSIDGRSGNDTLDYSGYVVKPNVVIDRGVATGVGGGISGVETWVDPREPEPEPEPPVPPPYHGGSGSPIPTKVSKQIQKSLGGWIEYDAVILQVPANVLPADALITIEKLAANALSNLVTEDLLVKLCSDVFEITTNGCSQFGDNNYVTIKIKYDPSKITPGEQPIIRYFDTEKNEWVNLRTRTEYDAKTRQWYAVTEVNHFSKFAVFSGKLSLTFKIGVATAQIGASERPLDAAPYLNLEVGRTMAPVRFLCEELGARVDWLADTQRVLITGNDRSLLLAIGSNVAVLDGEEVIMDCEPVLVEPGRTFAPLRFICESLGFQVDYDDETREIFVRAK